MENTLREQILTARYGPPAWRPLALLVGALAFGGAALVVPVLWAPAAVVLAGAIRDALCRPALVVTPEGFEYLIGLRRAHARWEDVEAIRVREERHFLAFGRILEVDLNDETLITLSKLQLGEAPDAVAEVLESAWRSAAL